MRHVIPLLGTTLLLAACGKTVEPASGALADLMQETFRDADFQDDDGEEALQALVAGMLDDLTTMADIEKLKDGRAVAPPPLAGEFLDGLPQPPDTTPDEQTPEAVAFRSGSAMQVHIDNMVDSNQNCMGSNSTKWADRRFSAGQDCFADGSCTSAAYESTSRTENVLANVWIDSFGDMHRTTLDYDGDDLPVMVHRGWIAEQFPSDNTDPGDTSSGTWWRQRYVLEVWAPDPADTAKTLRLYVMWSEADITAVGDDLYRTKVREGIEENYLNIESYIANGTCDDRDKPKSDWE